MRAFAATCLLLLSAVACDKSPSAPPEASVPVTAESVSAMPAPAEASMPVTLEQVNATRCARDSDCGIAPTPCQSGCGHPAVNVASPLYRAYLETVQQDRCCRPGSNCPVTACAQTLTRPVCRQGRCELVAP